MSDLEVTSLKVNKDTWKRLKLLAVEREVPLHELTDRAFNMLLVKEGKAK